MSDNEEQDNDDVPDWAKSPEFIHRFWRRVVRDVDVGDCDSSCYIYAGTRSLEEVDTNDYQYVYIPRKYDDNPGEQIGAHRVIYCIDHQVPLNKTRDIHHHCHTPACIRSQGHLEKVTRRKNIQIAHDEGRATSPDNKGERNGFSDLTEDEVLEIHYEFHTTEKSTREIAAEHGIEPGHTRRILQGREWPHTYEKICEQIPEDDRRPITNRGEHNGQAEFDPGTIRRLFRDHFQRGLTTHELADRYSSTERYIRKILNRKRWESVEVIDISGVPQDINDRPNEATSPGPKLTPKAVRSIFRDYYSNGLTKEELAEEHGVSEATIYRALTRATYSQVDITDIDAVPEELKDQ